MGHRLVLFKLDKTYLFDPIYGLIEWKERDWVPHLKRVAEMARTSDDPASFFTVECYRHREAIVAQLERRLIEEGL